MRWGAVILVCLALTPHAGAQPSPALSRADLDFFEAKIRPVLVERCYKCHSTQAKKTKGNLRLDDRASVLKGGDSGPAAISGHPDKSLLLRAVSYKDGDLSMPPQGKLPDHEVAALAEWVRRGLPYPSTGTTVETKTTINIDEGRKFWSFQPVRTLPSPAVKDALWVRRPLDAFVLAELEKRGLKPSPAADARTLIRRLYFDVIGLPPSPEEVDEFIADSMSKSAIRNPKSAIETLIDRLLESPHYGERWARYWLDLARYCDVAEPWAETKGQPFLYRDWVVQALNDDLPYDQFVIQQLAADLVPGGTPPDRAALGFLGLSPTYWKELKLAPDVIKSVVAEEWEERIHAVTSTFLGLTVSCARCHDHKFDPITTRDYYSLAGIFASTRLADQPVKDFRFLILDFRLPTAVGPAALDAAVFAFQSKIENQKSRMFLVPAVQEASLYVLPDGPHKTKLEYKQREALDVAMQIRGSVTNLGPTVPRRFVSVLSAPGAQPFLHGSGRLELARAIVTDAAPLTARVIVNRIWKHHFGRGLVETPSDFGAQGERPSHPQLLDNLAARFIASGWSLKWLHREILLSATYQQASGVRRQESGLKGPQAIDPDNRLLWRMPQRRLDVESWRDAMLAVSGTLDRRVGGAPLELSDAKNQRRTLYGVVKRRELSDLLRLHDFPDPTAHSANRVPTITPLQQLFTLNSHLMQQQAAALSRRLHQESPGPTADRIHRAYRLLYGRPATEAQVRLGQEYLTPENEAAWQQYAQVLLGSNEFAFVD